MEVRKCAERAEQLLELYFILPPYKSTNLTEKYYKTTMVRYQDCRSDSARLILPSEKIYIFCFGCAITRDCLIRKGHPDLIFHASQQATSMVTNRKQQQYY